MVHIWTEDEIEILLSNYANSTVKQLQEKFFNNFTLSQIRNKIFNLGLVKTNKKCTWTDDEREIVRRYYPEYTNRQLKEIFLNDKTERQINDCAKTIGVKKDIRSTRGWTQECVNILYQYYNDLSAKEIHEKYLPQFSPKQIAEFASQCIGIHKDKEVVARNRLKAQDIATLESVPQQITNDLLDGLNIKYIREEIFSFYSIDNYLVDNHLAIEVQGDYWHMNPTKHYERNKKRDNYVNKDIRKNRFMREKYGINILYLWEDDLKNNISLCQQMVIKYIDNNGIMENYHSFNYQLDSNGNLILIDNQYVIGY